MFSLLFNLAQMAKRDGDVEWHQAPWSRKLLVIVGLLLVASGCFHSGIFLAQGGSWEGPLSWRKPILFGISSGVTTLSIAWILGVVSRSFKSNFFSSKIAPLFSLVFSFSITGEVGLITLQTWRGVPSHFNNSTPVDSAIFYGMGILILIVSAEILSLTLLSFFPLQTTLDMTWAIRLGLIQLVLACMTGIWLIEYGVTRSRLGEDPGTFGHHGVMKFPHGLPMHTVQYLMGIAWLLRALKISELWRTRLVVTSALGMLLVTFYGFLQTLSGRDRSDFTPASAPFLFLGLTLFACPFICAVISRCWRRSNFQ